MIPTLFAAAAAAAALALAPGPASTVAIPANAAEFGVLGTAAVTHFEYWVRLKCQDRPSCEVPCTVAFTALPDPWPAQPKLCRVHWTCSGAAKPADRSATWAEGDTLHLACP